MLVFFTFRGGGGTITLLAACLFGNACIVNTQFIYNKDVIHQPQRKTVQMQLIEYSLFNYCL